MIEDLSWVHSHLSTAWCHTLKALPRVKHDLMSFSYERAHEIPLFYITAGCMVIMGSCTCTCKFQGPMFLCCQVHNNSLSPIKSNQTKYSKSHFVIFFGLCRGHSSSHMDSSATNIRQWIPKPLPLNHTI